MREREGEAVAAVEYRYLCPHCGGSGHPAMACPFVLMQPEPITPERMRSYERLVELERQGRLTIPRPGTGRFRWWWIPLGIIVFIVLVIVI
ncbi:hypothetical protein GCM10027088_74590 [Nocardia goodfellowii]